MWYINNFDKIEDYYVWMDDSENETKIDDTSKKYIFKDYWSLSFNFWTSMQ